MISSRELCTYMIDWKLGKLEPMALYYSILPAWDLAAGSRGLSKVRSGRWCPGVICCNRRNNFLTCDSQSSHLRKCALVVIKMVQCLSVPRVYLTLWLLLLLLGPGWKEPSYINNNNHHLNGCFWLMKVFLFAFFIQLSQQSYDANRPGNIMHPTYFTEWGTVCETWPISW